jgi:hypothetical protein
MIEADIQRLIQADATKRGDRLFRNNTAEGWVGIFSGRTKDGTVTLRLARPLHAGLCVGSPDLVGWTRVTITPAHVGRVLAVFNGTEVKTDIGRPSPEQINFIAQARAAGALAGIARSISDAQEIANGHIHD